MTSISPTVVVGPDAVGEKAADAFAALIAIRPTAAVVVATGRTPMGAYARLAVRAGAGLDTTALRVFQLDEYVGVGPDDERSLAGWMDRSFVEPLGIDPATVVRLDGNNDDLAAICAEYERAVRAAGGLDLAFLGLGPNGHLGFNEPPSDPTSRTRTVDLSAASLESNESYWGPGRVPPRAITAGMDVLLGAKCVVLVVTGESKRGILHRAVDEPPTPSVPASFLQHHSDVRVIADRAAWGA
jgi:glucosamine-6-phosphate deaminase